MKGGDTRRGEDATLYIYAHTLTEHTVQYVQHLLSIYIIYIIYIIYRYMRASPKSHLCTASGELAPFQYEDGTAVTFSLIHRPSRISRHDRNGNALLLRVAPNRQRLVSLGQKGGS